MSETPSPALPDDVHQLVADFFQRIPFNRMLGSAWRASAASG